MDNNGFPTLNPNPTFKGFYRKMGEFDFDSPPISIHTQQQQQPFKVGSEIEVSFDEEEGFEGSFFTATILKLPSALSPPSRDKKALVQYKTLLTDDKSDPLKELVDVLKLRPLPPDSSAAGGCFEEGDIVDAFCKDGWWIGAVSEVFENDGGYSVLFKNPLHVMDFQQDKLRVHQDWVSGNWVVPKKMDVSMLRDQLSIPFVDANVPEKVQVESLKNTETNNEKENSHSINSRNDLVEQPSISDKKSASFALASRRRRRTVSSKSRVSNPIKKLGDGNAPGAPAEDKLRETESKTPRRKSFRKNAASNRGRRRGSLKFYCEVDSDSPDKIKRSKGGRKLRIREDDGSDELNERGARFITGNRGNPFEQSQWTQVTDGRNDCDVLEVIPKKASTNNESERNKHLSLEGKWMTPEKYSPHLPDEVEGGKENPNNQTKEKGMEPEQQEDTENSSKRKRGRPKYMEEPEQQQTCKNSYKRKRGRPRKLMIVPMTTEDKEQDGTGWKPDQGTIKICVTDRNRKNWNDLSLYETNDIGSKSASSNIDDDDRPLLMWLGGMQGSASNNWSKLGQTPGSTAKRKTNGSCEQVDAVDEVRTVGGTPGNAVVVENHGWPFVKSSPVWSAIDSLDALKRIPQMPHFRTLSTYKEECREGLAVGCMVTYASLVDKISKLQFDNPRHVFESTLASLYDLEQHGFNISMLCIRVNELLFIKDTQTRYQEETKEAENRLLEHTENQTKLAEESKAIEQKITELQKKRAAIKLEMETKALEIATLQSQVETIRECNKDTMLQFERQITLPLV